jgi:hypothetical protein
MKALLVGILLFLLTLVLGIGTIRDYGITWDEPENFFIGRVYLNVFLYHDIRFLNGERALTLPPALRFREDYHLERYPPFAVTIASVFSYFLAETLHIFHTVDAHHISIIFFAGIGVAATYAIILEITGSLLLGIFGGLALLGYPAFFGLMHNDVKDVPLLSLYTLSVFFFIRLIKHRSIKDLICLSISTACATATKFNGVFLGVLYLCSMPIIWRRLLFTKKYIRFLIVFFILGGILGLAFLFLLWPWLVLNPVLHGAQINQYVHEVGRGLSVYFGRKTYMAGITVPWYYAPVLLIYQAPLILLGFAMIGFIASFLSLASRTASHRVRGIAFLWIIVSLVRYLHPYVIVYNGIRHFMEVLPALVICAVLGVEVVSKHIIQLIPKLFPRRQFFLCCIMFVCLIQVFVVDVRMHPYQMLYFNELAGGVKKASQNYDFDYWGFSARELVNYLNTIDHDPKKTFTVQWIGFLAEYFPNNHLATAETHADYIIIPQSIDYFSGAFGYWLQHGTLLRVAKADGASVGYLFATKKE